MRKHSKQREAIQFYLATHSNHPTAETVYLGIKEEFPNVSLGTVYRNLALLAENGEILKISTVSDRIVLTDVSTPITTFFARNAVPFTI